MLYKYQLTLTIKDTEETVSLSGSFHADAWGLLNEYLEYADDLLNTKYVKNGMPASLNIKWKQGENMVVSEKLPDWDDVIIFLHKFRPIGLQSENTNFYKVCNILSKELTHSYFRNMIDEQREIFNGKKMQSMFRLQIDDVVLNSEKVLNDWLNSYEYHRDKKNESLLRVFTRCCLLTHLK